MSKSRDEKIKLTANLLNAAAGSSLIVGVVAPTVAVYLNLGDAASKVSLGELATNAVFWLSAAAVLHYVARHILDGLDR